MASLINSAIFLDRNGFLFYAQGTGGVMQFNFQPNVIRDLEIINQEAFSSQLIQFINQLKVPPFQTVILLSDSVLFEKQFTTPISDENKEVELFLDNLPFEHIGKIVYVGQGQTCIATNRELYTSFASAFQSINCSLLSVFPAFAFDIDANKFVSQSETVLVEIFRKAAANESYNFLKDKPLVKPEPVIRDTSNAQPSQDTNVNQNVTKTESADKTRLFILIGVFVFMLFILGVVAFTML